MGIESQKESTSSKESFVKNSINYNVGSTTAVIGAMNHFAKDGSLQFLTPGWVLSQCDNQHKSISMKKDIFVKRLNDLPGFKNLDYHLNGFNDFFDFMLSLGCGKRVSDCDLSLLENYDLRGFVFPSLSSVNDGGAIGNKMTWNDLLDSSNNEYHFLDSSRISLMLPSMNTALVGGLGRKDYKNLCNIYTGGNAMSILSQTYPDVYYVSCSDPNARIAMVPTIVVLHLLCYCMANNMAVCGLQSFSTDSLTSLFCSAGSLSGLFITGDFSALPKYVLLTLHMLGVIVFNYKTTKVFSPGVGDFQIDSPCDLVGLTSDFNKTKFLKAFSFKQLEASDVGTDDDLQSGYDAQLKCLAQGFVDYSLINNEVSIYEQAV